MVADATIRQIVDAVASDDRWRVDSVAEPGELLHRVGPTTDMILVEESLAGGGYLSLIRRARKTAPALDAVVVGGPKSEEVLHGERREGVDQYYERPIDTSAVKSRLSHRMKLVALRAGAGIVGRSAGIEELLEAILQVAPTEVPILLEGESGTGKDVVAHAVHAASRRSERPFEAVNCGALAEGVLESELFGHEKGAFTGAVSRRAGLFERATTGTVFLDEVGETSPNMQVRLLRVLESGEVMRVGGSGTFEVDVRVIAATNRNLGESVRNGSFRQDLYYRLKGVNLRLPPLRERGEDIPLLVHHFISLSNRRHKKSVRGLEPRALERLMAHSWPGNIRELKNLIDTLVVLTPGTKVPAGLVEQQLAQSEEQTAAPAMLPVPIGRSKDEAEREMIYASVLALHRDVREILHLLREGGPAGRPVGLREVRVDEGRDDAPEAPLSLNTLERSAIQDALTRFGGNRRQAAEALGISERTLYRKIKEYGLV